VADANNLMFRPLVLDSFGRFHGAFRDLINGIIDLACQARGIRWAPQRDVFRDYWWKRISVVLQKMQSQLLLDARWRTVVHNNPDNIRLDESIFTSTYVEVVA
jgi:hypothetical protein